MSLPGLGQPLCTQRTSWLGLAVWETGGRPGIVLSCPGTSLHLLLVQDPLNLLGTRRDIPGCIPGYCNNLQGGVNLLGTRRDDGVNSS